MLSPRLLAPLLLGLAATSLPAQTGSYTLFGIGCEGTNGIPTLANTGGLLPTPGQPFSITVSNLPTNPCNPVVMLIAFDPFVPILLDPIGMPGCFLYVATVYREFLTKNPGTGYSTAEWVGLIPNLPNTPGARFQTQVFVVDDGSEYLEPEGGAEGPVGPFCKTYDGGKPPNALGATMSMGGEAVVGGLPTPLTTVRGRVFYDANSNGTFEAMGVPGEVPIPGWKVRLSGSGTPSEIFSGPDGRFEFVFPQSAMNTLTSLPPAPGFVGSPLGQWVPTTPTEFDFSTVGQMVVERDFGAYFVVNDPTVVRTPEFYKTPAGEAELLACDPEWRIAAIEMCLRTNVSNPNGEAGTLFLPLPTLSFAQAYQLLCDYINMMPRDVLAYILSRQVLAAELNRACGPLMDIPLWIDAESNGVLVPYETIRANTRALLCDPRSADTGPFGDPAWRAMVGMCLNEWQGISSNGDGTFTRSINSNEWSFFVTPY